MDTSNIDEKVKISLINLMSLDAHKIRTWVKDALNKILKIKSKRWIDCVSEEKKNQTIKICKLIKEIRPDVSNKVDNFLNELPNKYLVYNEKNQWERINKINTNRTDSAVLIVDIIERSSKYDIRKMYTELTKPDYDTLKELLSDMVKHKEYIWDNFLSNTEKYTANIAKNSEEGEIVENFVVEEYKKMGYEIIFIGGDGDLIDMEFGVDLIVKKDDVYNFVQIKKVSSIENTTYENENYIKINGKVSILNFSLIDTIAYGTLGGEVFIGPKREFYHKKDKVFIKKYGFPIPEKIYMNEIFIKN